MQCAVIEFGRNVLNLKNAHSTEINPETPHPVIDIMEKQKSITDKGGTMRLGAYPCQIEDGSLAKDIYGKELFLKDTVIVLNSIIIIWSNTKVVV